MFIPLLVTVALALIGKPIRCDGDDFLLYQDFPNDQQMRGFGRYVEMATPTETSVIIPSAPTTFGADVCSAYPEVCVNAGLFPKATGAA